jgi:hypothetical protein
MSFRDEDERTFKCAASLSSLLAACQVLAPVLTQGAVSAPVLLECLYYAADEDLLRLIRLMAALDPDQRAQVEEHSGLCPERPLKR